MTESMAEIAAEDMIVALRTQRAQLLERRAEMQMRIIMLEQEEQVRLAGISLVYTFHYFICDIIL